MARFSGRTTTRTSPRWPRRREQGAYAGRAHPPLGRIARDRSKRPGEGTDRVSDATGGRSTRRLARSGQLTALSSLVVGLVVGLIVAAAACASAPAPDLAKPASTGSSNGQAIYAARCASCHGADLRGTDRGPSHLSKVYEPGHHGDASFKAAIEKGSRQHHWDFGDMPPVAGLSPDEIAAVIAYVRSVQGAQGFEPYPPS